MGEQAEPRTHEPDDPVRMAAGAPPLDQGADLEDAVGALARLRATGARVILISGNHDSARRLGVNSALVDAAGVHLRTRPGRLAEPVILHDEHGPVAVYGVSIKNAHAWIANGASIPRALIWSKMPR